MQRRTFLSMAAVATLVSAGCSSKQDGGSGADQKVTADTVAELTLFYWDKNQTPTVTANIKSFNAKYPKIKVTTNVAGYKDYWAKLRTQAQGGTLPDVFWMNGPNIQLYAGNGMLAEIDSVTEHGIDWNNYPKALVDLYTVGGKHYGIPKDFDTIGVFYNKTIFKQAGVTEPKDGWTWDDFHKAAKAISDWGKPKGIWGCATTINGDGQATYYNTIAQAGGFVIKEGKSGFDDPKSLEGLRCWREWIDDGSVAPASVVADTKPNEMFKSGKSAMYWAGDWTAPELKADLKGREKEFDVVALPQKEKKATVIHGLGWVASKKSANAAAARALVAHMGAKESQELDAKNGTAIPAFTGTQESWVKTYPDWNCQMFVDAAKDYSVTYPVSKNTDAWADKEIELLTQVYDRKGEVDEIAKQLATHMNEMLAKEK